MILNVVDRKDPILTSECDKFDFEKSNAKELAISLVETMRHHGAPMIAANEVGVNQKVLVLEADPIMVLINPIITSTFGDETVLEETDLSRKGYVCKIKRPGGIRVRFQDINGETVTQRFVGMTARQILHGTETLNGVIFNTNATRVHRDKALKDFKKYERSLKRG